MGQINGLGVIRPSGFAAAALSKYLPTCRVIRRRPRRLPPSKAPRTARTAVNRLLRMRHSNRMAWPRQASATKEQSLSDVPRLVSAQRHFRVLNCHSRPRSDNLGTMSRAPSASQTVSLQSHNSGIRIGGKVAFGSVRTTSAAGDGCHRQCCCWFDSRFKKGDQA